MTSVKWLERVTVLDRTFDGYQQAQAYRFRRSEDDAGVPVTRIWPRALMVPPGVPDFMTRERFVAPRPCVVEGRAWSGLAPVASVDVSTDGGETWAAAQLEPPPDRWAWARWTWAWDAAPGEYELRCRACDEAGNEQPLEPEWNVGGYCNNAAQRVVVTVRSVDVESRSLRYEDAPSRPRAPRD
jgi:hypothetical protein